MGGKIGGKMGSSMSSIGPVGVDKPVDPVVEPVTDWSLPLSRGLLRLGLLSSPLPTRTPRRVWSTSQLAMAYFSSRCVSWRLLGRRSRDS